MKHLAALPLLLSLNASAQSLYPNEPKVTLTTTNCTEAPLLSATPGVIDLTFSAPIPPQWECHGTITIIPDNNTAISIVSVSTAGSAFNLGPKRNAPKANASTLSIVLLQEIVEAVPKKLTSVPFFDATYVIDSDGPFLFAEGLNVPFPCSSPLTIPFHLKARHLTSSALKYGGMALGFAVLPCPLN